jgi:hypothetical protein
MKQFIWIVAGLLATAPVGTAHAQELGPELTFDARTTRTASAPKVAVDASGQSVVVWESFDINSPSNESRVYARRLLHGQWLSPLFTIGARNGASQIEPVVASNPVTGRFVVAWTDRVVDPSRVFAQVFLPSGNPQGHVLVVDDRAHLHQINPAVAMASDGGFFVLWTGYQELATADQVKVYGRRYSAAGLPRGPSFRVSEAPAAQGPTLCSAPSGRFVATWTSSSESGSRGVVRRFNSKGQPLGDELLLSDVSGLRPMCRFEDDGFVLGWTGFENGAQVPYVQAYDAEGAPLADPRPLAADTDVNFPTFQSAAPLAGGGFLATWFGVKPGGDGDVFGRWMTATGEPASDPFQINLTEERQQQGIAVASASPGHMIAVWASNITDASWAILGRTIKGPSAP